MTTTAIPSAAPTSDLATGAWRLDPARASVEFHVRNFYGLMTVKGYFDRYDGTLRLNRQPAVELVIDADSLDTKLARRDEHLRSAEFFDVDIQPTMSFHSAGVRPQRHGYLVTGELTLRGVTRPVELQLEINGFVTDPWGGTRAGFSATGEIDRRDFGLDASMPIADGGLLVGYEVQIALEIEAVLTPTASA